MTHRGKPRVDSHDAVCAPVLLRDPQRHCGRVLHAAGLARSLKLVDVVEVLALADLLVQQHAAK